MIITRARAQAQSLADRLGSLGHEVVVCPLIELEPLGPDVIELSDYDWVVVTSANGARELVRRGRGAFPSVAAIGTGTAAVLRESSIEPALVPEVSTQEGLVAEFPQPAGRILFVGAEGARRHLADALGADFLPVYRTRELRPRRAPSGDLVVLASPSAARAWGALGLPLPAVSIGPETTRAAREAGLNVVEEAIDHDLDGLVAAVSRAAV